MNARQRKQIKKIHTYLVNASRTIDRQMKWVREDYGPVEVLVLLDLIISYCEAVKERLTNGQKTGSGTEE